MRRLLLIILRALFHALVLPCVRLILWGLATLENAVLAAVHHAFLETVRFLNGVSALALALCQRTQHSKWESSRDPPPQQQTSTLNAVVEALAHAGKDRGSPPPGAALGPRGLQPSNLFLQQAGAGVIVLQRGMIQETHIAVERTVSQGFEWCRRTIRAVFQLPPTPPPSTSGAAPLPCPPPSSPRHSWWWWWWPSWLSRRSEASPPSSPPSARVVRCKSAAARLSLHHVCETQDSSSVSSRSSASSDAGHHFVRRTLSFAGSEPGNQQQQAVQASCAADVMKLAGYPSEVHTVITEDGYVLTVERIPRRGCKDVVFFMHGMLDGPLAWVSGGVTGAQAFAAWEAGFDVFLLNNRCSPPRRHIDPSVAYFRFSNNEIATYDIGAQLDFIHDLKLEELGGSKFGIGATQTAHSAGAARAGGSSGHNSGAGQPCGSVRSDAGGSLAPAFSRTRLPLKPSASDVAPSQSLPQEHRHRRHHHQGSAQQPAAPPATPVDGCHASAGAPSCVSTWREQGASFLSGLLPQGRPEPQQPRQQLRHSRSDTNLTAGTGGRPGAVPSQGQTAQHNAPSSTCTPSTYSDGGGSISGDEDKRQCSSLMQPEPVSCQRVPYTLIGVGHSLGAMTLLMHCVERGKQAAAALAAGESSSDSVSGAQVHRLILLTPAGFHVKTSLAADIVCLVVPPFVRFMRLFWPRFSMPCFIPTSAVRAVVFKILRDVASIPSLQECITSCFRVALGGDASQWERAWQMPHYSSEDMPAMSIDQMLHLVLNAKSGKFQAFDYGSAAANRQAYGTAKPLDVAAEYRYLSSSGVSVDLVAGLKDGVIPPENVRLHYAALEEAGVKASYKELPFGHLDFTFSAREELKLYLLRLLRQ